MTRPPEIFDRNARRLRRDRVAGQPSGFFGMTLADDLLDRLDLVRRQFSHVLVLGAEPALLTGLAARGITPLVIDPAPRRAILCRDERDLGLEPGQYDLILSSGILDSVADLPGALIQLRRALRPDGLLLANFAGSPSLTALRQAIAAADADDGQAVARLHPQIDVRAAGDLLVRAGFALPVADLDTLDVAYTNLPQLIADLRAAASTNMLAQRYPVSRAWLARAAQAFAQAADPTDGRAREALSFITLTGWAPDDSQPRPARRGSATASLATALKQGERARR